jgi:hypothetical protein
MWVASIAPLSTVLAQDHFYSDFLSLHVTKQPLNPPMMMTLALRFQCGGESQGIALQMR